jgi:hypothetical protein
MTGSVEHFGRAGEWNAFVSACPGAPLPSPRTARGDERGLGHETMACGARRRRRALGHSSLVRVRSLLFGTTVSLPYLNDGGPLGATSR